jgi:hypothetical protein
VANDLVKVLITGPDGEVETPWARDLGDDQFELDNTPWFTYGLSWHDVIEARAPAPGEFPEFVRIVRKSGYRTIRVILDPPASESPASQAILDRLKELGCSYENMDNRLIGIDIPPHVDLMTIREFLITTEQDWEHADPEYDELFPSGGPAA